MNAKSLITLNNEYREKLTPENKKYYENLLLYIRLTTDKSEQETEEILYEILEHLLEAQAEGKSPEEVFGKDPKAYADEIIGELPKAIGKEQLKLGAMIIFYMLGPSALVYGVIHTVLNLFIKQNSAFTFSLGSGIIITIFDLLIGFFTLAYIIKCMRSIAFKNQKKWVEFLQLYGIVMLSIGLYILPLFIIPSFGPIIALPIWTLIPVGIISLVIGALIKKL